jgi:hypothetical protein
MLRTFVFLCLLCWATACTPAPTTPIAPATPLPSTAVAATELPPAPDVTATAATTETAPTPSMPEGLTLTVNEMTATLGAGRGDAPRGGYFYLILNLTLSNNSGDALPYDVALLSATLDDGTTYTPIPVDVENLLDTGTLNAEGSITANVVFEVPDGTSTLVLNYEGNPSLQINVDEIPAPLALAQ